MKTTHAAKVRPDDIQRLSRAFRVLSAFGTTGSGNFNLYPDEITRLVDDAIDKIENAYTRARSKA